MRTVTVDGVDASPSSLSSTTCSSSASSTGRMVCGEVRRRTGRGWRCRRRTTRSSERARPGVSSSAATHRRRPGRAASASNALGQRRRAAPAASASRTPTTARVEPGAQLGEQRRRRRRRGSSTTRCSTRPVLGDQHDAAAGSASAATSSTWRTRRAGQRWGTARPRPGGSAGRAAAPCGCTTSSRSTAPSRKRLRSPAARPAISGLTVASRSTNSR